MSNAPQLWHKQRPVSVLVVSMLVVSMQHLHLVMTISKGRHARQAKSKLSQSQLHKHTLEQWLLHVMSTALWVCWLRTFLMTWIPTQQSSLLKLKGQRSSLWWRSMHSRHSVISHPSRRLFWLQMPLMVLHQTLAQICLSRMLLHHSVLPSSKACLSLHSRSQLAKHSMLPRSTACLTLTTPSQTLWLLWTKWPSSWTQQQPLAQQGCLALPWLALAQSLLLLHKLAHAQTQPGPVKPAHPPVSQATPLGQVLMLPVQMQKPLQHSSRRALACIPRKLVPWLPMRLLQWCMVVSIQAHVPKDMGKACLLWSQQGPLSMHLRRYAFLHAALKCGDD